MTTPQHPMPALRRGWLPLAAAIQFVAAGSLLVLAGCASQAPVPHAATNANTSAPPGAAAEALACTRTSNCVNSLGGGPLGPLKYAGTPEWAWAVLRATLAEFPEAKEVKADGVSLEAVFTTPLGFKDWVDFRIDAAAQRIDYRSRSSFGLYDFGKNQSRMADFSARFNQQVQR